MQRIIIEMKDGTKHATTPGYGPNLSTVNGVKQRLRDKTYYRYLAGHEDMRSVWVWEVANVYEEEADNHGG